MGEHEEQVTLFSWAKYREELRWMFAIPNGGLRHKSVAMKMKAEGVKAGIWDIFLPLPRGEYHGLFIEMKYKMNKLTPSQKEFGQYIEEAGYKAEVAYSWEQAKNIIEEYLN